MPTEIICKACIHGPCKLGDLAYACVNELAPPTVVTVQDMVNYTVLTALNTTKDTK